MKLTNYLKDKINYYHYHINNSNNPIRHSFQSTKETNNSNHSILVVIYREYFLVTYYLSKNIIKKIN